jgi:hypothetical protein
MLNLRSWFGKIGFFFFLFTAQAAMAQTSSSSEGDRNLSKANHETTLSGGYLGLSSSSSQSNIAISYYYKPLRTDLFQVGGEYGIQKVTHRGTSVSNTALLAGVAINIGNLYSAFYCQMGLAIKGGSADQVDASETDPNGAGYHFLCGKRIPIGGNTNWVFRPSLGVIAGGTGGMVFRPLAVSLLF